MHIAIASDNAAVAMKAELVAWLREAGLRPTDGVWGSHWYDAVASSTGFGAPDKPQPDLTSEAQSVADACRPDYDYLAQHKIPLS